MTLVERARSRRPVTWLTLVGALLLPVVIGGTLVVALYNPTERLDRIEAAIVNDDDPVEVNGQLVPVGRQLTAGLVEGTEELPSNVAWTITNDEDAAAGLADGTYSAVVTIPADFSAAATSTAAGGAAEQATIRVQTPPDSLVVDDAISAQVTQAAASLTGAAISEAYLENVFLGFTTLGDQLGTAAEGAGQLAAGAAGAATGAMQLADGVGQVAAGADGVASGASDLSAGAAQLATGADQAAAGLESWSAGAQEAAANGRQLAAGLQQVAAGFTQIPAVEVPQSVVDAADAVSQDSTQINSELTTAAAGLRQLAEDCVVSGASGDICDRLVAAAQAAEANLATATGLVTDAGTIASGLQQFGQELPQLQGTIQGLSTGITQLSGGIDQLAQGATSAAAGVSQLADGAASLSAGASTLAGGADELAAGAAAAATGAADLSVGVGQLADGADELATGLQTAADELPSYTDDEAASLASVVAEPVAASGIGAELFGASAVPLLASMALWFGALGTFVALQAVTSHALSSRRPSALLALRSLAPAAIIGAAQGLLVAGVVQLAADYDWADWSVFAFVSMLAGIAFAAVNQALVAVFGGAGRWISALVGVLAVATGVVSTVPGALMAVADLVPTSPAITGMLAALTTADGLGAALSGLVIWSLLAFLATTIAVARRRTISARQLLAASPA